MKIFNAANHKQKFEKNTQIAVAEEILHGDEVIEIDSKVRKMISNQEEIDDIMKYLVEEQGVETLRDQALKLVKEGKTTVDEFNKIIAYID